MTCAPCRRCHDGAPDANVYEGIGISTEMGLGPLRL